MRNIFLFLFISLSIRVYAQTQIDFTQFKNQNQRQESMVIDHNVDIDYDFIISSRDFGKEIGQSFKIAGITTLSIGIPNFAVGTILLGYGYGKTEALANGKIKFYSVSEKKKKRWQDCIMASYYLVPFGAAMTIVGIPLYIRGQKLMEFKVDYTSNGASIALAW